MKFLAFDSEVAWLRSGRMRMACRVACTGWLLFFIGCEAKPTTLKQPDTLLPVDSASVDGKGASDITDAEVADFANQWVQAVAEADRASATRLVDWDGIIDRSIEGFDISESVARGYKQGAKQNGLEVQLVNALASSVANGGSYQLVRVVKRGGQQHAVFRLVDPQAGLNYHDLRLRRDGGRIQADRFFIAATGEEMADTLRAVAGPALQSQGSLADKL